MVYARSDGAASWAQPALEAVEPAVARIDEAVEVLQAEPQAVASSVSFGTPRRLRRKISCEVVSPGQGVDPVLDNMVATTCTQGSASSLAMSPPSRRLKRKTSAAASPLPGPKLPESPEIPSMTGGLDAERDAGPSTTLASPSLRRLRRKSSAEEAAPVVSPAAALLLSLIHISEPTRPY